jgi:hypothetical protein
VGVRLTASFISTRLKRLVRCSFSVGGKEDIMLTFGELSELAMDLAEQVCKELYKADEEPLDRDEVGWFSQIFELEINLRQGNLTYEKYLEEILNIRRELERHEENFSWR